MCDIADTTYLYPFTTTVAAKTTPKGKEATAGRETPSTSHPPTSVPTEGEVEEKRWIEATEHIVLWSMLHSGEMLNEVHALELLFIVIDAFPVLQHAQDTHFV